MQILYVIILVFLIVALAIASLVKKQKTSENPEMNFSEVLGDQEKLDESAKLWNALKKTNEHNHDRLSGYEDDSCTSEEHWKKQLDDFLSAGIISKQEYAELLKQRQQQYHE